VKIPAAALTFLSAGPFTAYRRPKFLRRGTTLQLLETALLVEGYRQRFYFPLLDRFFLRPLSEWTTVTIPYTRILDARHDSRAVAGAVLAGLFALLAFVLWLPALFPEAAPRLVAWVAPLVLVTPVAMIVVAVTFYLYYVRLRGSNWLTYREADGGRAVLRFRFASRRTRLAFEEALERNRRAARGPDEPARPAAEPRPGGVVPLVVLAVLLVGSWLGKVAFLLYYPNALRVPGLAATAVEGAVDLAAILALAVAARSARPAWRFLAGAALFLRGVTPMLTTPDFAVLPYLLPAWIVFHTALAGAVLYAVAGGKERP